MILKTIIYLFVLLASLTSAQKTQKEEVIISDGALIGATQYSSRKGTKYNAFQGIPFASPPVGSLRFAPPIPNEPWSPSILDASEEFNTVCWQNSPGNIH